MISMTEMPDPLAGTPFAAAKDRRVYTITELVNLTLAVDITEALPDETRAILNDRIEEDPDWEGIDVLFEHLLESKGNELETIRFTFGPEATLQSAIKAYTDFFEQKFVGPEPLDFGDLNWVETKEYDSPLGEENE